MGFHSVSESSNDNGSDRCFPMVKYGSCNRVGINVKRKFPSTDYETVTSFFQLLFPLFRRQDLSQCIVEGSQRAIAGKIIIKIVVMTTAIISMLVPV